MTGQLRSRANYPNAPKVGPNAPKGGLPRAAIASAMVVVFAFAITGAGWSKASAAPIDRPTEMQAREAFASGRFDDALALFAKLYAQTLHPVYLRNIGRCHQKMHQPDQAIDSFKEYLAKGKKITPEDKQEVEGYIHEMEALRESQARAGEKPSDVLPSSTPSSPPPQIVPATPPLATDENTSVVLKPLPPLEESPPPIYTRWWFWSGIGAVVVGGVVGAILLTRDGRSCPADLKQCM